MSVIGMLEGSPALRSCCQYLNPVLLRRYLIIFLRLIESAENHSLLENILLNGSKQSCVRSFPKGLKNQQPLNTVPPMAEVWQKIESSPDFVGCSIKDQYLSTTLASGGRRFLLFLLLFFADRASLLYFSRALK